MALQPNGAAHGLTEDAERVQALGVQLRPRELRQHVDIPRAFADVIEVRGAIRPHGAPLLGNAREPRPTGVIAAFVRTCQRWRLPESDQLVLLGYRDNEFFGLQLLRGRWLSAPQDVRDRTGYVLGISVGLGAIFNESIEAEVAWLNHPHQRLRGQTPLALMLQGAMRHLMTVNTLVAEERAVA